MLRERERDSCEREREGTSSSWREGVRKKGKENKAIIAAVLQLRYLLQVGVNGNKDANTKTEAFEQPAVFVEKTM